MSWQFVVETACRITGRGVAVFGTLSGTVPQRRLLAYLHRGNEVLAVDVSVEYSRRAGGEEIALLVRDITEPGAIPPGSVIRSE